MNKTDLLSQISNTKDDAELIRITKEQMMLLGILSDLKLLATFRLGAELDEIEDNQ